MKVVTLVSAPFFMFISAVQAAPNCDAIIAHGLRNIEIAQSDDAAVGVKYFRHCQKNFDLMTDSQLAQAEVEVFGYGSGDGSYTRQRREERLQQWCTTSQSVANRNRSSYQQSQTIFQGAVSAWENCNALSSKGLIINPRITPDRMTVDLGIVYRGYTRSGIVLTGIATEGFDCTTVSPEDSSQVEFPIEVRNLNIHARCIREAARTELRGSQEFQVMSRGTISIQSSSDPFQLYFAEEWDPGLPMRVEEAIRAQAVRDEIPVGTVIASVLSPEQFFSQDHPQFQENEWAVADGAPLPPNSAYGKLAGTDATPDLRFLNRSKALIDVRVASLRHGQNVREIVHLSEGSQVAEESEELWTWLSSGRDNEGKEQGPDWQQAVDQFQNFINDSGTVISQGRTYNFARGGIWGPWNAGEATVLGIASQPRGLLHYIKIN